MFASSPARLLTLALPFAAMVTACGSCPPPRQCPVCPAEQGIAPAAPVATACAEEWIAMPILIGFPTGGSQLAERDREILAEVVRTARTREDIRRVRVEGHADTCGGEMNNVRLSQDRAERVSSELVRMGVPREMLETVGYGSSHPRANEDCRTRQSRASSTLSMQTNRRVEFSVLVCRDHTRGGQQTRYY